MMKNLKNCSKFFFTAQKKRLDALNATQKTSAYNKIQCLEKSRKTFKKLPFFAVLAKSGNFWSFIFIFSKTVLSLELWFLHFVQCMKALLLSYQKLFLEKFQTFHHKGCWVVEKLPNKEKRFKKIFFIFFNQGKKWNNKMGGRRFGHHVVLSWTLYSAVPCSAAQCSAVPEVLSVY